MLAAFSCYKKPPVNLIGRWESNIRYEQELAEHENDDIPLGCALIEQANEFIFFSNGTFSRNIKTSFIKAKIFSEKIKEEDVIDLYKDFNTEFMLSGQYELQGKKLTLLTSSIQNSKGESFPYEDFYKEIKAYGLPHSEVIISVIDKNRINIQGIEFNRVF